MLALRMSSSPSHIWQTAPFRKCGSYQYFLTIAAPHRFDHARPAVSSCGRRHCASNLSALDKPHLLSFVLSDEALPLFPQYPPGRSSVMCPLSFPKSVFRPVDHFLALPSRHWGAQTHSDVSPFRSRSGPPQRSCVYVRAMYIRVSHRKNLLQQYRPQNAQSGLPFAAKTSHNLNRILHDLLGDSTFMSYAVAVSRSHEWCYSSTVTRWSRGGQLGRPIYTRSEAKDLRLLLAKKKNWKSEVSYLWHWKTGEMEVGFNGERRKTARQRSV